MDHHLQAHEHKHTHHHSHGHSHSHAINIKSINNAFIIGILLNFLFVVIEVVAGLRIDSLSLLSDAGHNLADVASLALSLFAFRMIKVRPTVKFTYGYKKTTILVALFNAAILLLSIGAIGFEAVRRLIQPTPVPGRIISTVAAIGIAINAITALLFLRNKENDLNIKSAFMHLMADAVVSAGLVVGGIIIFYTKLYWLDALLSLVIAGVILVSTWQLLKDSLKLSLDGVPEGINLKDVQSSVLKIEGVKDFHHIHIWALSTTENALTAHLVVSKDTDLNSVESLKREIKHQLLHLNIQHVTLETEMEDVGCGDHICADDSDVADLADVRDKH